MRGYTVAGSTVRAFAAAVPGVFIAVVAPELDVEEPLDEFDEEEEPAVASSTGRSRAGSGMMIPRGGGPTQA